VLRQNLEPLAQAESQGIGKPSAMPGTRSVWARAYSILCRSDHKFGGQTLPVSRGGFDFTLRTPMGVWQRSCRELSLSHRLLESGSRPGAGNAVVLKPPRFRP